MKSTLSISSLSNLYFSLRSIYILYTFKIPHLPVLNVTAGTHTLMITLLEENLEGECQEILTYLSEFTCIAKKPKLKMITRRKGKNVKWT
ncbi:MAG: hypothetical protein QXM43_00905 [Desulfurococcaceae archaeon]